MGTTSHLAYEMVTDAFNARDLDRFANALADQFRLIGNTGEPL